jgi:octaprenyl-diphosphate synthase
MSDITAAYRLIEDEMVAMEELAVGSLSDIDPFVGEVIRYSIQMGGKRLRPALLFLVGKATGSANKKHIRTATAIEFVHTATLIHDDILDGAAIRRHWATVNIRWNAQVGVLAGDLLLTKALELMSRDDEMHGFRRLTEACRKTCEGELQQIGTIGRFGMSPDEYFRMIAGKTAPLLACSTELGAYYSGTDNYTAERFRLFGHKLGLAFQITDDILDLVGDSNSAGKTLRTDLLNRKPTLPLILYLHRAGSAERDKVLKQIGRHDFNQSDAQEIISRFCDSGVVELTRQEARRLVDEAVALIAEFPGDAITALIAIAQFVLHRKN